MILPKTKTVYELFNGHPERWIQDATALDKNGNEVDLEEEDALIKACKLCVLSAIYRIYGTEKKGMEMAEKLRRVIPILQITEWQDDPEMTFDKMLAKIKAAGI